MRSKDFPTDNNENAWSEAERRFVTFKIGTNHVGNE